MLYVWTGARRAALEEEVAPTLLAEGVEWRHCPLDSPPRHLKKGDVVLAMGAKPLEKLQAAGIAQKGRKVHGSRERRLAGKESPASILVSFDPGLVAREPDKGPLVAWDLRLAARLHKTGTMRPKVGKYRWVPDLSDLIRSIKRKHRKTGKPVRVAWDLETMGLFPWYPDKDIVTSAWTDEEGRAYVVDRRGDPRLSKAASKKLRRQVRWLLTSPMVRCWGANLKFDLQWVLEKWGIRCSNFTLDILIGASLLNENRHNSLNLLAKTDTEMGGYDDAFNATADKEHMDRELARDPDGFLTYAGGDADATLRVGGPIARELHRDRRLSRFYRGLLHPAARCFEDVERRGVVVDLDAYRKLRKEVNVERKRITREAMALIPRPIRAKHIHNLKLTRDALLRDHLFTKAGLNLKVLHPCEKQEWVNPDTGKKERAPSTSIDDHLAHYRQHPEAGPFVRLLEELGKADKTLNTYIDGFLKHLRPDGRFHPTYAFFAGALWGDDDGAGTVTGRLSAKDPAVQTIPKHTQWAKALRRCLPAPPGMVCWQIDFSQGELRVAACLAGEQNMLDAYARGIDLHAITGAMSAGLDPEEVLTWKKCGDPAKEARFKEVRQRGKAGNFGLLYGMGAEGFVSYAYKAYGVEFSLEEAERFRDTFFRTWPALLPWHDHQREMARRYGMVRSPLGRIRHLPQIYSPDREIRSKAGRQAINSPVQSALSDLCLFGIVHLDRAGLIEDGVFEVNGSTHDSAYGYVREDVAEERVAAASRIMGNLPIRETFEWDHQIPFPVDVELGATMGDLVEQGHLASMKLAA